jgi:PilZ domain
VFEIDLLLDNLSASGLYLRLPLEVSRGTKLFTVIRLSTSYEGSTQAARVATRGVVVRTEPYPDGTYGVGVVFTRSRFL